MITLTFALLYTFAKTHHTVYFKWVHFITCEVCINKVDQKRGGGHLGENLRCWVHLRRVYTWRCLWMSDEGGPVAQLDSGHD